MTLSGPSTAANRHGLPFVTSACPRAVLIPGFSFSRPSRLSRRPNGLEHVEKSPRSGKRYWNR
jgi:hypothetical protein